MRTTSPFYLNANDKRIQADYDCRLPVVAFVQQSRSFWAYVKVSPRNNSLEGVHQSVVVKKGPHKNSWKKEYLQNKNCRCFRMIETQALHNLSSGCRDSMLTSKQHTRFSMCAQPLLIYLFNWDSVNCNNENFFFPVLKVEDIAAPHLSWHPFKHLQL